MMQVPHIAQSAGPASTPRRVSSFTMFISPALQQVNRLYIYLVSHSTFSMYGFIPTCDSSSSFGLSLNVLPSHVVEYPSHRSNVLHSVPCWIVLYCNRCATSVVNQVIVITNSNQKDWMLIMRTESSSSG